MGPAHPYTISILPDGAHLRTAGDFGGGGSKMIPGPDGKTFFGMGLYTSEGKRLTASPANSMACIPALQGQFYLAIPAGMFHPGMPNEKKTTNVELRIAGDSRPLLTLTDVEAAMRDIFRGGGQEPLSIEQRYHFIPDAQLLVTIPTTADRLVLRKLNLDDALEKSGIDYLFVASTPFPYAVLGADYTYPIQIKSKKGGVKYRVESGPDGMKVAGGVVAWKVPANFQEGPADVIMTISDAAGQEVFHTFKLTVVRDLPPRPSRSPKVDPKLPVKKPDLKKDPDQSPSSLPPRPRRVHHQAEARGGDVTRQLPDRSIMIVLGGGGRFIPGASAPAAQGRDVRRK